MKEFVSWLVSSLGYLVYTAMVLLFLLWWLFPAESLRVWAQEKLNTGSPLVKWEIGGLQASWPFGLTATGIRLLEARDDANPLLQVDTARVMPDLRIFRLPGLEGKIPLRYDLQALGGAFKGRMSLAMDEKKMQAEGIVEDVELGQMANVWKRMNRTVTGRVSGTYSFDAVWPILLPGMLDADLSIADGEVSLQQPVFGLSGIAFSETTVSLQLRDRIITLDAGKLESRLLAAEYKGTVSVQFPLFLSEVSLDGSFEPRPELLAGLQDTITVNLIKNQLQDSRLSFAVSGTIMEPGILFQGASGVIDGIIQGSGR